MAASRILFSGRDASGNARLWVTNATPAGTSQLAVAGANFVVVGSLANPGPTWHV